MNDRRRLLVLLAGALAASHSALAQQPGRRYRLGVLSLIDNSKEPYALAFFERLAELGFIEGRNFSVVNRHADSRLERLPAIVAEMAKLNCDAFFSAGNEANLVVLRQATRDTPIVFVALDFDLVAAGHVDNMARPGGRITGLTAIESALPAKRLEILKDLLPGARKIAVFTNEQTVGALSVGQEAAKRLGFALHVVDFKRPPFDYEVGFADATRAKADALLVLASAFWVPARQKLVDLALKAKLPSMFAQSQWAAVGGLVSYGYNFPAMWRRGADLVARVLRGAKPADIPVEQPAVYELAINMKTAKALGIKIPPTFLLRADRVIE